jgi:hypothetical protein
MADEVLSLNEAIDWPVLCAVPKWNIIYFYTFYLLVLST